MAETDEKEAQLTAYYDKEMGELKGAREEYAAVMGGAIPADLFHPLLLGRYIDCKNTI